MACRKVFLNIIQTKNTGSFGLIASYSTNKGDISRKELTEVTHTGQVWDSKDYRNVRFTNSSRYVNPSHSIKLKHEDPVINSNKRVICCDGGGGPLGHPKVYINLDKPGVQHCHYCGLRFEKDEHHH